MGDWQRWLMHSPLKRDQAGSIPASPTRIANWQIWICTRLLSETKWVRFPHPAPRATKRRHSITDQCSELLPRTMRVQISLPLPMWGCGPTDEGARLRTLRSEFNSLHPYQTKFGSRGLKHDDASVLTKRSGLDSRREFQMGGWCNRTTRQRPKLQIRV